MKTKTYIFILLLVPFLGYTQIDIQPDAIAINECAPISDLAVNSKGLAQNAVHVESDDDVSGSTAIFAKRFEVTGFADWGYAVIGDGNAAAGVNFAVGVAGNAIRTSPSNDGRSFGLRGQAGDSTPGANFGVFGALRGSNYGTAILGYDSVSQPGWGEVLLPQVSYAGYFRGKGYFHDNVGISEEDPQSKLHVVGGDIYVEGSANGVILTGASGGCYRLSVDAAGAVVATAITCP